MDKKIKELFVIGMIISIGLIIIRILLHNVDKETEGILAIIWTIIFVLMLIEKQEKKKEKKDENKERNNGKRNRNEKRLINRTE